MSWSIEEHIGEGRPWPEQVVVYRGETDESLTYARRSLSDVNQMVELMDTLAAENAKLRELVRDYEHCSMHADCDRCEYDGTTSTHCPLSPCFPDADELCELGGGGGYMTELEPTRTYSNPTANDRTKTAEWRYA